MHLHGVFGRKRTGSHDPCIGKGSVKVERNDILCSQSGSLLRRCIDHRVIPDVACALMTKVRSRDGAFRLQEKPDSVQYYLKAFAAASATLFHFPVCESLGYLKRVAWAFEIVHSIFFSLHERSQCLRFTLERHGRCKHSRFRSSQPPLQNMQSRARLGFF